jgi:xanthine dehydrogenase accessory factor
MLVQADGSCIGTIGGGCMEAEVQKRALWLMKHPKGQLHVCRVDLCASDAEEEGMVCGGVIEVLLENI